MFDATMKNESGTEENKFVEREQNKINMNANEIREMNTVKMKDIEIKSLMKKEMKSRSTINPTTNLFIGKTVGISLKKNLYYRFDRALRYALFGVLACVLGMSGEIGSIVDINFRENIPFFFFLIVALCPPFQFSLLLILFVGIFSVVFAASLSSILLVSLTIGGIQAKIICMILFIIFIFWVSLLKTGKTADATSFSAIIITYLIPYITFATLPYVYSGLHIYITATQLQYIPHESDKLVKFLYDQTIDVLLNQKMISPSSVEVMNALFMASKKNLEDIANLFLGNNALNEKFVLSKMELFDRNLENFNGATVLIKGSLDTGIFLGLEPSTWFVKILWTGTEKTGLITSLLTVSIIAYCIYLVMMIIPPHYTMRYQAKQTIKESTFVIASAMIKISTIFEFYGDYLSKNSFTSNTISIKNMNALSDSPAFLNKNNSNSVLSKCIPQDKKDTIHKTASDTKIIDNNTITPKFFTKEEHAACKQNWFKNLYTNINQTQNKVKENNIKIELSSLSQNNLSKANPLPDASNFLDSFSSVNHFQASKLSHIKESSIVEDKNDGLKDNKNQSNFYIDNTLSELALDLESNYIPLLLTKTSDLSLCKKMIFLSGLEPYWVYPGIGVNSTSQLEAARASVASSGINVMYLCRIICEQTKISVSPSLSAFFFSLSNNNNNNNNNNINILYSCQRNKWEDIFRLFYHVMTISAQIYIEGADLIALEPSIFYRKTYTKEKKKFKNILKLEKKLKKLHKEAVHAIDKATMGSYENGSENFFFNKDDIANDGINNGTEIKIRNKNEKNEDFLDVTKQNANLLILFGAAYYDTIGKTLSFTSSVKSFYNAQSKPGIEGLCKNLTMIFLPILVLISRLILDPLKFLFSLNCWRKKINEYCNNFEVYYMIKFTIGISSIFALGIFSEAFYSWSLGLTKPDLLPINIVIEKEGSRMSSWVALGFITCFYPSFEGTLHRGITRSIGIIIGVFSAWCALTIFPSNLNGIIAWVNIMIFIDIFISLDWKNPVSGFHLDFGYAGQIFTYTEVLIVLLSWHEGNTTEYRTYYVVTRIVGNLLGIVAAIILAYIPPISLADTETKKLYISSLNICAECYKNIISSFICTFLKNNKFKTTLISNDTHVKLSFDNGSNKSQHDELDVIDILTNFQKDMETQRHKLEEFAANDVLAGYRIYALGTLKKKNWYWNVDATLCKIYSLTDGVILSAIQTTKLLEQIFVGNLFCGSSENTIYFQRTRDSFGFKNLSDEKISLISLAGDKLANLTYCCVNAIIELAQAASNEILIREKNSRLEIFCLKFCKNLSGRNQKATNTLHIYESIRVETETCLSKLALCSSEFLRFFYNEISDLHTFSQFSFSILIIINKLENFKNVLDEIYSILIASYI